MPLISCVFTFYIYLYLWSYSHSHTSLSLYFIAMYIYIMYIIVYNIIINMYIIYGFTTLLHSWAIGSTTYIYIIIQMFGCSAVRLIPFFTLPGEEVCSSWGSGLASAFPPLIVSAGKSPWRWSSSGRSQWGDAWRLDVGILEILPSGNLT